MQNKNNETRTTHFEVDNNIKYYTFHRRYKVTLQWFPFGNITDYYSFAYIIFSESLIFYQNFFGVLHFAITGFKNTINLVIGLQIVLFN